MIGLPDFYPTCKISSTGKTNEYWSSPIGVHPLSTSRQGQLQLLGPSRNLLRLRPLNTAGGIEISGDVIEECSCWMGLVKVDSGYQP
jgi:hypothetical protein